MPSRRLAGVAALVGALSAAGGHAEEPEARVFSLRGFGTLSAVHSNARGADFVSTFLQPDGAGQSNPWSAGVDSRLGLQVDAAFNERFSAVVQVVAQHRYDDTYTPQIEWANLKYQVTPDFSLRLGRTVADQFMVSEARLVSYISPWVRPPQEVYGMAPLTNKDGADATYRFNAGAATDIVRASYGVNTLKLSDGSEIEGKKFFDLNNTLEYGHSTLRLGYTSSRSAYRSADLEALFDGLTQFGQALSGIPGLEATGAQALALVDRYRRDDFRYTLFTVGASYDPGPWLLMAEWATATASGLVFDATAWYVMGGRRIGQFTFFAIGAQLTADKPDEPGITLTGLPAPLAQAAAALNGGLSTTIDLFASAQESASIGLRWELPRNAALKLQYDHIELGSGSSGRLGNLEPDFRGGGTVGVFSASVDFVF